MKAYIKFSFLTTIVIFIFVLAGCEDGGSTDSTGLNEEPSSEGDSYDPLDISGKLPYRGSVSEDGYSYYIVKGLDPTVSYKVSLTELNSDADICVSTGGCSTNGYTTNESVSGTGGYTEMIITISDKSNYYNPPYNGTTFLLSIVPDGDIAISDGTAEQPLSISTSPHTGQVSFNADSYYKIVGLVSGSGYELHVRPTIDSNDTLTLYSDKDFFTAECQNNYFYDVKGTYTCTAKAIDNGAGDGELYFTFKSTVATDLNIEFIDAPTSEGTADFRKILELSTDFPYLAQVGNEGSSWYQISGLTPGQYYKIDLLVTSLSGISSVILTNTSDINIYNVSGNIYSYRLIFEAPADGFVNMDISGTLFAGARFEVSPALWILPIAEGTQANPVDITLQLPYGAQVPNFNLLSPLSSYYKITGLIPGQSVTIELSDIDSTIKRLSGGIYNDSDYSVAATKTSCTFLTSCGVVVPSSGELYLKYTQTDTITDLGGYFTINLIQN